MRLFLLLVEELINAGSRQSLAVARQSGGRVVSGPLPAIGGHWPNREQRKLLHSASAPSAPSAWPYVWEGVGCSLREKQELALRYWIQHGENRAKNETTRTFICIKQGFMKISTRT